MLSLHYSRTRTLWRALLPLSTYTLVFLTPKTLEIYSTSSKFASPSLGGAAMLTPIYSEFIYVIFDYLELGFPSITSKYPFPCFLMLYQFVSSFSSFFSFSSNFPFCFFIPFIIIKEAHYNYLLLTINQLQAMYLAQRQDKKWQT